MESIPRIQSARAIKPEQTEVTTEGAQILDFGQKGVHRKQGQRLGKWKKPQGKLFDPLQDVFSLGVFWRASEVPGGIVGSRD